MRYRRTRASTTEVAAGIGANIGKSWVGDGATGGNGTFIQPGQQQAYASQPTPQSSNFANNVSGTMSRMFFQSSNAKAQQIQGPTNTASLPQAGINNGNWLSGGGLQGPQNDSRPKSAGIFGSSSGTGVLTRAQASLQQSVGVNGGNAAAPPLQSRYTSSPGMIAANGANNSAPPVQQAAINSGLSYGSIKNRFLSAGAPSPNNTAVSMQQPLVNNGLKPSSAAIQYSNGSGQQKSTSKLFSGPR